MYVEPDDTVLTQDLRSLYTGKRDRVVEWLIRNATNRSVCLVGDGDTLKLMTVDEYLRQYDEDNNQ